MTAPDLRRPMSSLRLTGACTIAGGLAGAVAAVLSGQSLEIRLLVLVLAGLFVGLVTGLLLSRGSHQARHVAVAPVEDGKIRTEADLLAAVGPPVLGIIPDDRNAEDRPVLTGLDSHTPRAEALRHLRTNLQFMNSEKPPQAVTVTSSVPGEGRTTVAVNLAVTLAQNGRRVLLVDADLRSPNVHSMLGLDGTRGLVDILVDDVPLEHVQQTHGEHGLQVLTAGTIPANPSELLGSKQMLQLLHRLDEVFDHIVLDAPPLLAVTDAAVLSKITDGVLIVVKAGGVDATELERTVGRVTQIHGRMLGTVLTFAQDPGYHLRTTTVPTASAGPAPRFPNPRTEADDIFPPAPGPTRPMTVPDPDTVDIPVITITSLGNPPPR